MNPLSESARPLVHGHRGCRGLRPENTLPAFLHALELGVDVLELDVVISADHHVIVSHEPWLSPTICLDADGNTIMLGTEQQHNLYALPYATIRRCECGLLKHPGFPEQQPHSAYKPLLSEVLAATEVATRTLGRVPPRYSIEIKSEPAHDGIFQPAPSQLLPLVLAVLQQYEVLPRVTLLCFDNRILQLARQVMPALPTCLLLEQDQAWFSSIEQLGFVPAVLGPDFCTVSASAVHVLRSTYPTLQLVPWTVNETLDMQYLMQVGVEGITTDYPDRLIALLAQ